MKALALDAGFKPDEVVIVESVGEPDVACDDELILVLASPSTCADPEIEDLRVAEGGGDAARAAGGGEKVRVFHHPLGR